jgi:hypothetical protein
VSIQLTPAATTTVAADPGRAAARPCHPAGARLTLLASGEEGPLRDPSDTGRSRRMSTTHTTAARPGAVRPTDALTYTEAAELTGVSADTIERDRKKGRYPNAYQDAARRSTWTIPVGDLVSAGRLAPQLVEQAETELAARRESRELRELRERVIRLEEQLRAEQQRAESLATDKATQQKLIDALVRKVA